VIHVATVHWRSDRWIGPQLRYLDRFLPKPHRLYAFLDGVETPRRDEFHFVASSTRTSHARKLNRLAEVISADGRDSDPLLFIDGDAFPIAPLDRLIAEELPRSGLVAVCRAEMGDPQPHPSFCLTTVGDWRRLEGDWRDGPTWENAAGREITDVGARMLENLERDGMPWLALLRSNRVNHHPLFFGVYGDLVYHQGGGFRAARGGRLLNAQSGMHEARLTRRARFLDALPTTRPTKWLRRHLHPARRIGRRLRVETARKSREMYERIERDPDFFLELIGEPEAETASG